LGFSADRWGHFATEYKKLVKIRKSAHSRYGCKAIYLERGRKRKSSRLIAAGLGTRKAVAANCFEKLGDARALWCPVSSWMRNQSQRSPFDDRWRPHDEHERRRNIDLLK
jgi:hypothetical protein